MAGSWRAEQEEIVLTPYEIATPVGRLVQTAFITSDIRIAMEMMTRTMSVGPWFLRRRGVFARQRYRGEPTDMALAIAMGHAGDMQFEIIQQLDDKPSVYREVAESRGYGLHHFGVAAEDFAAACRHYEAVGFECAYDAVVANGARVAYFDTFGRLPAMIEVIEFLPASRAMFERIRQAAIDWDGTDPVRELAPV
jgi:hypothetical protein